LRWFLDQPPELQAKITAKPGASDQAATHMAGIWALAADEWKRRSRGSIGKIDPGLRHREAAATDPESEDPAQKKRPKR
jgi:hypothetical protein